MIPHWRNWSQLWYHFVPRFCLSFFISCPWRFSFLSSLAIKFLIFRFLIYFLSLSLSLSPRLNTRFLPFHPYSIPQIEKYRGYIWISSTRDNPVAFYISTNSPAEMNSSHLEHPPLLRLCLTYCLFITDSPAFRDSKRVSERFWKNISSSALNPCAGQLVRGP